MEVTACAVRGARRGSAGRRMLVDRHRLADVHLDVGSGAQRLPNTNTLICAMTEGHIFEVTPDGVRAELTVKPTLLQPMGIVHGGVWCSVVESLASVSAYVWLSANGGGHVVGVNNSTDFLRAVTEGTVYGVSEPVHRGRRQQLWQVSIRDDRDRLVARGQVRLQNLEA